MRESRLIISKATDATAGYVVVAETPVWASNMQITVFGDDDTDSTQSSFGYKLYPCSLTPAGTVAGTAPATIATTTGGDGTHNEVQTITFNATTGAKDLQATVGYGFPEGAISVAIGDGTSTCTAFIPVIKGEGWPSAQIFQDRMNTAIGALGLVGATTATAFCTVTAVGVPVPTASATQTIYTVTFGGGFGLTDMTAMTVDSTRLIVPVADTATNFIDWDGITAQTTQSTSEYTYVQVGPGITGIADDDTAHTYKINGIVPRFLAHQIVTDVATDTACTYTYQVITEFSS